jgi:hypothetical protein
MNAPYVPPDPAFAERIYQEDRESDEQRRRLEHASSSVLAQVLLDPAESRAARENAMLFLGMRRDPALKDLLPRLFDDPDMGEQATRWSRHSDPEILKRLRALLDHPNSRIRSQAALALVRQKDPTIRIRLLSWWHDGDEGRRNVAIQGLMRLDSDEARNLLRDRWEAGGQEEEERLVLAAFLLQLRDRRGLPLLEAAAQRAEGNSVFAATTIAQYDNAERGMRYMLRIADHGDREAKQSLVSHAWNMTRLSHAFTADGIYEARAWVEQQLEKARRKKSDGQNI